MPRVTQQAVREQGPGPILCHKVTHSRLAGRAAPAGACHTQLPGLEN